MVLPDQLARLCEVMLLRESLHRVESVVEPGLFPGGLALRGLCFFRVEFGHNLFDFKAQHDYALRRGNFLIIDLLLEFFMGVCCDFLAGGVALEVTTIQLLVFVHRLHLLS